MNEEALGGRFMSLAWLFPARKLSFPRIGPLLTPSQDNYWIAQSPPRFKLWKSFSSCQFKRCINFQTCLEKSVDILLTAICCYWTRSLLVTSRACDLTRQDEPVLFCHRSVFLCVCVWWSQCLALALLKWTGFSYSNNNYSTGCPNFKLLPFRHIYCYIREIQYHVCACAFNQVI